MKKERPISEGALRLLEALPPKFHVARELRATAERLGISMAAAAQYLNALERRGLARISWDPTSGTSCELSELVMLARTASDPEERRSLITGEVRISSRPTPPAAEG